jgi:maltokinase
VAGSGQARFSAAHTVELVDGLARLGGAVGWHDLPGRLRARLLHPVEPGPTGVRAITVDQTHASVVVGERLVVKWMRDRVHSGRPLDLLTHLAEVGFAGMPTPYAVVVRGDEMVALVTRYLPRARDGWDWCVDAVLTELDGGTPADVAPALGALVAELHVALATPSGTLLDPVRWTGSPQWIDSGPAVLAEAVRLTDGPDGRWLAERVGLLRADLAAAGDVQCGWTIPIHGDLHVGQILRWRDGDAVTDFDGNPTVGPASGPEHVGREPAARDVAQMRTSLAHVGRIVDRRTDGRHAERVHDWAEHAAGDFLTAYRQGLAGRDMAHLLDEGLLRPFEVEQECRELVYAARFLPRWRYAPMGVLRSWYG